MRWMVFMFVVRERMTPHKAGRSGLDMDQYRMLFCTCKVPGVTKDTILNYFKTGIVFSSSQKYLPPSLSFVDIKMRQRNV
jgi:hypothetical protein